MHSRMNNDNHMKINNNNDTGFSVGKDLNKKFNKKYSLSFFKLLR